MSWACRLEPLRGLWLAAGVASAWSSLALPFPWAWGAPLAFVGLVFLPRSTGTRMVLVAGALLGGLVLGYGWRTVPPGQEIRGTFEIEIRRQVKAGRYEAEILRGPRGTASGALVRIALDSAAIGQRREGPGTLRPPRAPGNPGGFDEARWAASAGLAGTLLFDSSRLVGSAALPWDEFRQDLGDRVRAILAERLDAPSADLWIATLLADGTRLPQDVNTAFRQTGLYHMLSVSGFHLVVLGGATILALSLLRTGAVASAGGALATVWLYVAFLGFPDPAVRSAVAFSGFVLARWTGRRAHAGNALGVGAAVLVLLDPNSPFQAGVQLTFVATASLIWLAPGIDALLLPRRCPAVVRSVLKGSTASLAATLSTAPLLAWNTGLVPWIGIPAGLLASGFFSAGFLASLAVVATSALPEAWVAGFAGAAELCARAVLEVALRAGAWEDGWFQVVRPSVGSLVVWFSALGLVASCAAGAKARRRALVGLALLAPLFLWKAPPSAEGPLVLTFLSVGQGDATLVQAPGEGAWLVDGGPRSHGPKPRDAGRDIVVPALRALRIPSLEGVVVTHPDLDHWGGVPAITEAVATKVLVEPSPESPDPSEGWTRSRAGILARGTRPLGMAFGERIPLGRSGALLCLAPGLLDGFPGRNEASLVLAVRWGRARALLAGDAEFWTEDRMLQAGADLRADLLKVGHHGSKGSSGEAFLSAVRPRWAVLSCGARNRYGHPHQEAVARLERVGAALVDTRSGAWRASLHADGRIEVAPAEMRWWNGPWEPRLSFP